MRRLVRLLFAIMLCSLLLSGPIHFWISDHAKVLRLLYPISAAIAGPTLNCSQYSPDWMREASRFSLWVNKSPAGQLVYIPAGGETHECHYGWTAFPFWSEPVSSETRFRYASMTKLLTADLVLRRVRVGRLELSDLVMERLNVIQPQDMRLGQMTVEHLLRHSAGFDRFKSTDPMVIRNKKPWCPYETEPLTSWRLDFPPGSHYAYSNLNYCLLGMMLERVDTENEAFRVLMEREYNLSERDIRFIDGPYLEDEVTYDFRNSVFYDEDYWRYFDFQALSSAAGLSGSALALGELIVSLQVDGGFPVISAPVEEICREEIFRGCYRYGVFSYRKDAESLRIYVQPGLLYGAPSLAIIDEHGGITVWVGNGTRHGGGTTDAMLDQLYAALAEHYAAEQR